MQMRATNTTQLARAIAPYVATIVSVSLAVTLRVEHSCSASPAQVTDSLGVVTGAEEVKRDIESVADHSAVMRLGRNVK